MKVYFVVTFIAILLLCWMLPEKEIPQLNTSEKGDAKVELIGESSKRFVANEFIAQFFIELRDKNKDSVYQKLSDRRAKVFEVVKSLEIPEKNIEQNSVSLRKDWAYKEHTRTLIGYIARQNFLVKVDSRKEALMLMQILSSEEDIEIFPVETSLKNQDSLQGVIIEQAVKEGLNKAKHYAAGADLKLGKVLYMSSEGEGTFSRGRTLEMNRMVKMDAFQNNLPDETAIADSVEISARVRLIVELK